MNFCLSRNTRTLGNISPVYLCNLTRLCCSFHLHSSGIELVNAAALLLLFLLNLLLVGRQEKLKRSEMVHRLKGIITQLSGESGLLTQHGRYRRIMEFVPAVKCCQILHHGSTVLQSHWG